MTNNNNMNDPFLCALIVIGAIVSFPVLVIQSCSGKTNQSPVLFRLDPMKELGKRSLREKKSITQGDMIATFQEGDYENICIVNHGNKTVTVKDVHKAKVMGKWTAKKGKEFSKELFKNLISRED